MMSDECHRVLKQVAVLEGKTMSEFMYQCARAYIHKKANVDNHFFTILQSEGITVDNY
tara:strand:- start:687 stop:860 length:174 start_codon:yes stop_codon:yes gene_type:complete